MKPYSTPRQPTAPQFVDFAIPVAALPHWHSALPVPFLMPIVPAQVPIAIEPVLPPHGELRVLPASYPALNVTILPVL
ncbi:hypothetical protein NIES4101_25390 (plasmid) [Calothrix sp. NIES-4101]|nr:hypothetical protein NIES4101_25390 [Calothrix sp. NIES-4101]